MSVTFAALLAFSKRNGTHPKNTHAYQTQEKAIVDLIVNSARACESLAGLLLVSLKHFTRQLGRLSRLLNGIIWSHA